MLKFLVAAVVLVAGSAAFAKTCKSADGLFEVSATVDSTKWVGVGHAVQTTLTYEGEEIPRVREFCLWTPSVRNVLRCPHRIEPGLHAEVYPKFPTDLYGRMDASQPMSAAQIVIQGRRTIDVRCR